MEPLAVTGTGAVSPLGVSAPELCEALLAGRVGIRPAPWAAPEDPTPDLFGAVDDRFDATAWADKGVVAGSDGFAHFALAAAAQAIESAGLARDGARLDPLRTAIVHGTSMGGLHALMRAQRAYEHGGAAAVDPKTMIQIWPNMAAAQLAMRYGCTAPR
jgi:3-oxoacyl-[acyl-carrier-protein] synthase II